MSQKQFVNPWHFDLNRDIGDTFIKDIRQTKIILDKKFIHKNTIVISCNYCFNFQLFITSLEENSMLDTLNCRFVTSDSFSYDESYSCNIFTGNSQFVVKNYFYSQEQKELFFTDEEIDLKRRPLRKSCFYFSSKKALSVFL